MVLRDMIVSTVNGTSIVVSSSPSESLGIDTELVIYPGDSTV